MRADGKRSPTFGSLLWLLFQAERNRQNSITSTLIK